MAEHVALRRHAVGASGSRSVVVDGVRLAYDDEGDGPAIVCLHAIGHGAGDFTRLRARLRDRHRVLALDWPGQGRSDADRQPPSAARYADLLDGFIAAAGVERPVLVGNSIGGAAALRFTATRPGRVEALVLENPGGLAAIDDAVARTALAAMGRFFAAGARGARWFPTAFAVYYRLAVLTGAAAAPQRRCIVASAAEIAPLLRDAWRGFASPDADLRALAPRVASPVLFAWATGDRFVQLARSRAAIEAMPNARLREFACGHAPHLELPDAFEAAVESFLGEVLERDDRRRDARTVDARS